MKSARRTIALRFSDNFAPINGTIVEHKKIIEENGFVWYGKLGSKISSKVATTVLSSENPKILLIHSGKQERYWAYLSEISFETPELSYIPKYYRNKSDKFGVWFKLLKIEDAPKNILSYCIVVSSKSPLSEASKHSMNPYFIIDVDE